MSSQKTTLNVFDQEEYANTFYYCEKDHPFIVFTTCYCPMCDVISDFNEALVELDNTERHLDSCHETHEDLVVKVTKHAPELLI